MPTFEMVAGPDCGDLGYDLGYLRHGSFGRAARWLGKSRRVAVCAAFDGWPGVPVALLWRAGRPSNGLDADACRLSPRDGAVAVMGALLSMSLLDVMGALSIPVDMRAACPRVRCPSW